METLIGEGIKAVDSILAVIVLVLIGKDFLERRQNIKEAAADATMATTVKSILDALASMRTCIDRILEQTTRLVDRRDR
jgi:hypothetical protein